MEVAMARSDAVTFARKRKLNLAGGMKRRIDPSVLEKAVGADETVPGPAEADTPLGFVAVRQELAGTLRSTGGRPGFSDAERRKIPVTEPVWRIVAQAAEAMAGPGFHPSAAQVASAILAVAVRTMAPETIREAEHALRASRTFAQERDAHGDRARRVGRRDRPRLTTPTA
jgi:hypothetical protein